MKNFNLTTQSFNAFIVNNSIDYIQNRGDFTAPSIVKFIKKSNELDIKDGDTITVKYNEEGKITNSKYNVVDVFTAIEVDDYSINLEKNESNNTK